MAAIIAHVAERVVAASDQFQDVMSSRNNAIPHMQWEQNLEQMLALSKDQLRFALALFASVLVGWGIRLFRSPTARHLYSLLSGVALTYYPFGSGVVHALPPTILTYLAMVIAPRKCGVLAWYANFPYLIYLHVVNASGHNWMLGQMDFTGCEMVLVLKLISVAVSYQDYHVKKKEDMNDFQAAHALAKCPTPLEFLSYVFCLGNLLAGPYIEFSEYKEFMDLKGVWDPSSKQPMPSVLLPSLNCLAQTALFMGLYLRMLPVYNVTTFKSDWYNKSPQYMKMVIIFVAGITNQFKYCFAWKLSEASLTLAGMNFAGWDASTGKAMWGRCCNVHWFRILTCDTARLVPHNWNIGTGQFLRRYVYERLTPKGRKPGFVQLLLTQMTSAVWHGLYPGYLCFFVGSAVWIYFSTMLWKAETKFLPRVFVKSLPWVALKCAWTNFVLNYMASAFMVLELRESLRVYGSIHYWPHAVMLAGCILGPMVVGGKGGRPTTNKGPSKAAAAAVDGVGAQAAEPAKDVKAE